MHRLTVLRFRIVVAFLAAGMLFGASCRSAPAPTGSSDYLYLWTSAADSSESDFLAVYDLRSQTSATRYGDLVTTVPVPGRGNRTHHTEHELAADRQLFANGFGSGQSF